MIAGIPPWLTWTILGILGLNVVIATLALVNYLIDRDEARRRWIDFKRWEHEMEDDDVT